MRPLDRNRWLAPLLVLLLVLPWLGPAAVAVAGHNGPSCRDMNMEAAMCATGPMAMGSHQRPVCCRCKIGAPPQMAMISLPQAPPPPALFRLLPPVERPALLPTSTPATAVAGFVRLLDRPPGLA